MVRTTEGEVGRRKEEKRSNLFWPVGIAILLALVFAGIFSFVLPNLQQSAETPRQEKTSIAGIPVSLASEQAEKKLNTLYIDPRNPGKGVLFVKMKDIMYLESFRIADTEYGNLRFEIHKKDSKGFISHLRIDGKTKQGRKEPYVYVQVWDKLPETNEARVTNGAIMLDTANSGFRKMPSETSILRIEIS